MARARKPAKPAASAVPAAPLPPPPPAPPLPDWYSSAGATSDNRNSVQTYSHLAYQVVDAALAGHLALPTFQRAPVWTREQQVLLLDSLVRGWTIGGFLVWKAPRGTSSRPLHGCPEFVWDAWHSYLVLDGQQRLTALVAAALGELEVRWDGERWGPTGYLDAKMCFHSVMQRSDPQRYSESDGWWDHQNSLREHAGKDIWSAALHAWENVHRAEVQLIVIEGDEQAARDAYWRFNSTGTAHTSEEL